MISQRLRFQIFARDTFRCRYCGRSAADTALQIDHVFPVSLGGTDDQSNLVTACVDCNQGKGARLLPGQNVGNILIRGLVKLLDLLAQRLSPASDGKTRGVRQATIDAFNRFLIALDGGDNAEMSRLIVRAKDVMYGLTEARLQNDSQLRAGARLVFKRLHRDASGLLLSDGRCPDCGSSNLKDKGGHDKCLDCGRRITFDDFENDDIDASDVLETRETPTH